MVDVAVPVIVKVHVTVVADVPVIVTMSAGAVAPAVSVTGFVAGVEVRENPVPEHPVPVTDEDKVTGPAKPARLIAVEPVGRLAIVRVSVVEPPDVMVTGAVTD